jgi:hypothetical protein
MIFMLVTAIVLIFIYEIWSLKSPQTGDTISEIIWKLAKRPIVPFAFGVLMGHFFW